MPRASGPRARAGSAARPPAARPVCSAAARPLARAAAVGVLFLLLIAILPTAVEGVTPFVQAWLLQAVTPRPTPSTWVEAGESLLVAVAGRPVAELVPTASKRWVSGQRLVDVFRSPQPQGLEDDLAALPASVIDPFPA